MKIKMFAAQIGLSPDTLRYYEKEGLLRPKRNLNGYREYSDLDIEWITFILKLKKMGMPLAQIKSYARLRHMGKSTIPARYAILQEHHTILVQKQQELAEYQAFLACKMTSYQELINL